MHQTKRSFLARAVKAALALAILPALLVGTATISTGRPAEAAGVRDIIYQAASDHGVDGYLLYKIAECETGGTFNPYSVSPLRADGGRDYGLFQFHYSPRTGWTLWNRTPYAGYSVYDAWAASNAAAWAISRGYLSHWSCANPRYWH